MAAQFSGAMLDVLLAPGISTFNEAEIPDLSGAFPEAEFWLTNHFLNSLLGARYKDGWRQAAVTLMFRTQGALRAYTRARNKTIECIADFRPGRPASRLYFEALSDWETTLFNVQVALNLVFVVINPAAQPSNEATKIRNAFNRVKHFAEDIKRGSDMSSMTLPLWLTKQGLATSVADITFTELADSIRDLAQAADSLQNPGQHMLGPELR